MACWFGLGLLAIGLTTWLARDAADSAGRQAVARALAVTYGIGVILALWGTSWALQRAGLGRGGTEPASRIQLRLARIHQTEGPHGPPREGVKQMGRIVLTQLASLDGVMQSPGSTDVPFKYRGWVLDYDLGPEGDRFKLEEAQNAEALLLGRVTYEAMQAFWPTAKVSSPTG